MDRTPIASWSSRKPSKSRWGVAIAALVLGGASLWFSTAFTASIVLSVRDPSRALMAWPTSSARSTAAALITTGPAAADNLGEACGYASQALAVSAVDAMAVRVLALCQTVRGDQKQGRALFQYGEALSRRDLPTQLWFIEDRVGQGDINGALLHYDRAMRTSTEVRDLLLPVLVQASNNVDIARQVGKILAGRPDWWSDFLGRFVERATTPESLAELATQMRLDFSSDLERHRLMTVLDRLIDFQRFGLAKKLYDRTVPGAGAALLDDGGFANDRPVPPIGWRLIDHPEHSGVREPRGSGSDGNALSIRGADGGEVARKLLVLPPGTYQLSAVVGDAANPRETPASVVIACAGPSTGQLGSADFATSRSPAALDIRFSVPVSGCTGQWLSVKAPYGGDALSDDPWIDSFRLARDGNQP